MILKEKIVYLIPLEVGNTFRIENSKFAADFKILGSKIKPVARMVSERDMLSLLMPPILGINPNSKDTDFDKAAKNYWDSLSVLVPSKGEDLNITFDYDFTDNIRSNYIKGLVEATDVTKDGKTVHKITDSESLANYVEGFNEKTGEPNINPNEKWKYGNPVNPEDYLLYRWCLYDGEVANSKVDLELKPELYGKCTHFLHDEDLVKGEKERQFKVGQEAIKVYAKILESTESVENVLLILNGAIADNAVDNGLALEAIYKEKPLQLIEASRDKNLTVKATIKRYISANILRMLPNTEIVIDANDPSVVLGNSLDEAVSYFSSEINKAKVSEFTTRYKALK